MNKGPFLQATFQDQAQSVGIARRLLRTDAAIRFVSR